MVYKPQGQKNFLSTRKYYSIINKLERENLIDEKTQLVLKNLPLEDIIAVKLELSARAMRTDFFTGVPIWSSISNIVKDAVLKFAFSCTRSRLEAAKFLGISFFDLQVNVYKFHTAQYFADDTIEQKSEGWNDRH